MEYKKVQTSTIVKTVTILIYSLIILSIIYLYLNSPVSGYELSIYNSIIPFWALIFCAISIAIVTLVYQANKKNYEGFWFLFIALMLSVFIILTLPVSRGYFLYGSNDITNHYHTVLDIISTGNFIDNYYPIAHILGAELSLFIPDILPHYIVMIIPPIFTIIFILFTYFLTNAVFKREDYSIMATALGVIPLYSYYHIALYPHSLALLLLPIIFYLYFRSTININFKILLIIFLVLQAFVHVIPLLIITGCMVIAEIFKIIINKIITSSHYVISFNAAIVSVIVFFAWWSSYSVFGRMDKAITWLIGESQTIPREYDMEVVSNLGQQLFVELYVKMYANQLVFTFLTILTITIILYYFIKKQEYSNGLILSAIIIASALIYMLYFLASGFATIGRFLGANYGVWAMPAIIAFLFTKVNKGKVNFFIISCIIIILFIFSTLNIYKSEWTYQPNWQITTQDIFAKQWQNDHGSNKLLPGIISSPWGGISITPNSSRNTYIPPHFGYNTNDKLGEFLRKDGIIYYGEVRQKLVSDNEILNQSTLNSVWALSGFSKEDYNKLNLDDSVNSLYSNGEIKILIVNKLT